MKVAQVSMKVSHAVMKVTQVVMKVTIVISYILKMIINIDCHIDKKKKKQSITQTIEKRFSELFTQKNVIQFTFEQFLY